MELNGWLPRKLKVMDSNYSQSNANETLPFDQFKVLQRGNWEKPMFENTQAQPETESCLLENQLIQNFRPASTAKELKVTKMHSQHHSKLVSKLVGGQKYMKAACGLTIDSKQFSPCCSATFHQFIVGSNASSSHTQLKVSDQNFVEEYCEGEPLSSSWKKKLRTAAAEVLNKDQRVPLEKSPDNENCYSLRKEDEHCSGQPADMTNSMVPKYRPSSFEAESFKKKEYCSRES